MDEQPAPIVIVVLRPPGAGKGTQSSMLANLLRIPHISIGSLLRSYARDESEAGVRLRGMMALGNLVPDTSVLDVLATRIGKPDCARGLVLDGFPRTLGQAELLERGLLKSPFYASNLRDNLVALHLRVQKSTIVGRLSGRRICSRCSATYHLETQPPRARASAISTDQRSRFVRTTVSPRYSNGFAFTSRKPHRSSAITLKKQACWKSMVNNPRKISLKKLSWPSRACSASPLRVPRMSIQPWKTICEMVRSQARRRRYFEIAVFRFYRGGASKDLRRGKCHTGELISEPSRIKRGDLQVIWAHGNCYGGCHWYRSSDCPQVRGQRRFSVPLGHLPDTSRNGCDGDYQGWWNRLGI